MDTYPEPVNYKYRKKPVVIEAFQMTRDRRWDNSQWPNWLNLAWQTDPGEGSVWIDPDAPIAEGHESAAELVCGTLEGVHRIDWDDWIIQGIKGELYPCKPDIFEATYDPVCRKRRPEVELKMKRLPILQAMPDIWDDQTFLVSCSNVLGELAHWAVVQSPWVIPKALRRALCEFHDAQGSHDYFETSCKTLRRSTRALFEICPSILAWNVPTKGDHPMVFVSRYDNPAPDYDFIDLDALARNIAHSITLAEKYFRAHDDK